MEIAFEILKTAPRSLHFLTDDIKGKVLKFKFQRGEQSYFHAKGSILQFTFCIMNAT